MCVIRRERQRQRQSQRQVKPVKSNFVVLDDRECRDLISRLSRPVPRAQPSRVRAVRIPSEESNPSRPFSLPFLAMSRPGWKWVHPMPLRTPHPHGGTSSIPVLAAAAQDANAIPFSYSTLASGAIACSLLAPQSLLRRRRRNTIAIGGASGTSRADPVEVLRCPGSTEEPTARHPSRHHEMVWVCLAAGGVAGPWGNVEYVPGTYGAADFIERQIVQPFCPSAPSRRFVLYAPRPFETLQI
jgi:hypothetical protein